jgi:hypothetical protein
VDLITFKIITLDKLYNIVEKKRRAIVVLKRANRVKAYGSYKKSGQKASLCSSLTLQASFRDL